MKKLVLSLLVALAPFATAWAADDAAPHHTLVQPDTLQWGPAPPALPAGATAAVLTGDPGKEGSAFTIRLNFPDGYKVPPHWHPSTENVTVVSGVLHVGVGDTLDPAKGDTLKPGGFVSLPANMHHYAWAEGPTVIQVHGVGPFALTYVNPADDPRSQAAAKP